MTVVRHETILDADHYQFTLIAGPARELVHGRYPELPLGIFAEDAISVKVGIKGGPVHVVVEVHGDRIPRAGRQPVAGPRR